MRPASCLVYEHGIACCVPAGCGFCHPLEPLYIAGWWQCSVSQLTFPSTSFRTVAAWLAARPCYYLIGKMDAVARPSSQVRHRNLVDLLPLCAADLVLCVRVPGPFSSLP